MSSKNFIIGLVLFYFSIFIPFWVVIPYFLIYSNRLLDLPVYNTGLLKPFGVLIIIGALTVVLDSFLLFNKIGHGTPAPIRPPKKFVISGLYKYTRNPMYIAYIAVLLSEFFIFGHLLILVYAFTAGILLHIYVVKFEEPVLRKRFGKEYIGYTRKVRRWLII